MKSTKTVVAVVLALVLATIFFADDFLLFQSSQSPIIGFVPSGAFAEEEQYLDELSDIEAQDLVMGNGSMAVPGSNIVVSYKSWVDQNGVLVSKSGGDVPLAFTLGRGEVISGWDAGLLGMKQGGVRRIFVPPQFGYGRLGLKDEFGNILIPPNTGLVFEVLLLSVNN